MEHFAALKRRATDLVQNLPQSMPAMPSVKSKSNPKNTLKGTWEKIYVPPLPRSSHSIDIVAGTAYIFGGEINPREPVDNDMHVVTLPYNSAGGDYYPIKARASRSGPAIVEPETIQEEPATEPEDKGKGKELDDIPLASPPPFPPGQSESVIAADSYQEGPEASTSKGKEPAGPDRSALGDVPAPRVGHATAVIGSRIFLFGGRGGSEMKPLDEAGRVWVFDTKERAWSYLDPVAPAAPTSPSPVTKPAYPTPRSYHSAVATDKPRDFDIKPIKRTESWKEWAQGDSETVGIPQRPIVGNVANRIRDEDADGYGTFIIHGGCFAEGRANDTWAFDVRSRIWMEFPSAPGNPRGGTAIAIAKTRLYRFGGFNGESEEGGQLDYLELAVDRFSDMSGQGEVYITARSDWKSLVPEGPPSTENEAAAAPLNGDAEWPGHRSVAGLEMVNLGGGREYLVLALGEREPSGGGHEAAGKFWDDIWAFQVPLHHDGSAASVTDTVWNALGKKSGEGKWFKVETEAYDDEDDGSIDGPGPRGWIATAALGELEERGLVIWGGLGDSNSRLGDGWIFRLGSEKREP